VLVPLALDRLWHEKRFVLRIVAGLSAIVNIIAIFYTYSRNGFVSMVFAVGLLFAQRRPNIVPWLVTLALGFAIIQFVPSTFTDRLSTLLQFASPSEQITDASFRGRLSENLAAWNMFQDNPLLGVGLGNFRVNYQAYSREIGLDDRRTTRTPANLYLELLSEQGLVGTAIFFLLMYIVVKNLLTASRQFKLHGMITEAYMSTAILSGFAGYMFAAINKNSAYSNVFWLLIGIMLSAYQVAQSVHEEKLVGVDPHPGVRE
jgi:O-antigen ligase